MDKADLQLLFEYNRWANSRVLTACRELSTEQMLAPAQCSFGSLMGVLAHVYGAEHFWRQRLQEGISPTTLPSGEDFKTLQQLEEPWVVEEQRMREFVDALAADDLSRRIEYATTSGRPQTSTMWKALAQVVFHGAQFRAEAGSVLATLGHSPGDLDFVFFLRETDQR